MKRKSFALFMITAALFTFLCGSVSAQEPDCISVMGYASIEAAPDMTTLYGSLEKKAPTAAEARELLAQQMAAVKRVFLVQSIGEQDISTIHYSLQPEYIYEKNKQRLTGYTARADYRVRVRDLEKLSDVLDRSINAGLSVYQVDFGLNNQMLLENRLLDEAVNNAKNQAAIVARAGGRTLGMLIRADLGKVGGSSRMLRPQMLSKAADYDNAAAATQLEPGVLTVEAQIRVVFGLQ